MAQSFRVCSALPFFQYENMKTKTLKVRVIIDSDKEVAKIQSGIIVQARNVLAVYEPMTLFDKKILKQYKCKVVDGELKIKV